jgi:MerR family transcriptional regulator, redox-sensitive transcriptional activator SoxR
MPMMTIGQVAERAGINPSAIRFYERKGLLPAPGRVNGQRRYDAQILERLKVIQLAQQAGFTIAEIHALFTAFPDDAAPVLRWQALATGKIAEMEALIERATIMKALLQRLLECECSVLTQCGIYPHP